MWWRWLGVQCVPNPSKERHILKRHEHFCAKWILSPHLPHNTTITHNVLHHVHGQTSFHNTPKSILLDPDNVPPPNIKYMFHMRLNQYADLFNPAITAYNGTLGPFEDKVNMGPVEPPQRKGCYKGH